MGRKIMKKRKRKIRVVRSKWNMPHKSKKDYDRKKETEEVKKEREEENKFEIECRFRKMKKFPFLNSSNEGYRFGRFHKSNWLCEEGLYPLAVWIEIPEFEKYSGIQIDTVIEGCINFLNNPKTATGRKRKKSLYGNLSAPYQDKIELKEDENGFYLSGIIFTDDIKNRHFWY